MWAALVVACGGSEFSAIDGAAQDAAHPDEGGEALDSGNAPPDAPSDDSSVASDADVADSGDQRDASGERDAVAPDSGSQHDASVGDAGACTGLGQCDSTHPCPSSGVGHVTCCPSIISVPKQLCGSCSTGLCPG
jgi:hypothetical protein